MQGPKHKLHKSSVSSTQAPLKASNSHIAFTNLAPRTPSELYWASRAQKAEALLTAREKHYEEIGRIRQEESSKRNTELRVLEHELREKQRNLERLVVVLAGFIVLLVAVLVYFIAVSRSATQSSSFRHAVIAPLASLLRWPLATLGLLDHENTKDRSSSSLNLHFHLPSHFTIPILSPWTSVIERQTSHVNNTASSSSYYLIFLLVAPASFLLIYFKVFQYSSPTPKTVSEQQIMPTVPTSNTWQLHTWQLLAQLFGAVSPLSFLQWAWRWGYWLLYLSGLAPR